MNSMNDFDQTPQPPAARGGSSAGLSFVSAIIGGAIVAVIIAALIATGVIGGKETVVQGGGVAATTANSTGDAKTVGAIYKEASPAVVSIAANVSTSDNTFGQQQEGTATGTGFVISEDGYIVTNDHVVDGHQGDVKVTFNDDKTVPGKVIGQDPSNDVAIVKVDKGDHDLTTMPLGTSSKVAVGDPAVAIGNPFGLNQTVTTGIVSALQRTITAPNNFSIDNVIQTDAAINPGNSGGPLINSAGEVIGINSQIATGGSGSSGGNVGIGFAVPIDTVKRIIPQLEKNGKVSYPYLGVSTGTLPSAAAKRLNLGTDNGAVVACVVKGGPADKAGLTAGGQDTATIEGAQFNLDADVITKVAGTEIKTSSDVQKAVLQKQPGDKIDIEVVRNGKDKTLQATLGTRPSNTQNNCSVAQTQP
jgi:S1-C subfamily serine protease